MIKNFNEFLMTEGKEKSVELPDVNIELMGFGRDRNGNAVIKLKFFSEKRGFSIQTNNARMQKTHKLVNRKLSELEESDLKVINDEVVDYITNNGSKKQKSLMKVW